MKKFKICWFDPESQKAHTYYEEATVTAQNEIEALKKWHLHVNAHMRHFFSQQTYEAIPTL